MIRTITKSVGLAAIGGVLSLLTAGTAEAALSLQINAYTAANVLTHTITINDEGAGDAALGTAGQIVWIGNLGNWVNQVDTGKGAGVLANQPHLDLAYTINNTAGAAGDYLELLLSQDNNLASAGLSSTFGGTNNGNTSQATLYRGNSNVGLFNLFAQVGATVGPFGNGAFAGGSGGAVGGAYSLTQVIRLTKTAGVGAQLTASGDYEVVPEPGLVALFGLGLAGLAAHRRRKA